MTIKTGQQMLEEQAERQRKTDARAAISDVDAVVVELAEFARGDHSLGSETANEARVDHLTGRANRALGILTEVTS